MYRMITCRKQIVIFTIACCLLLGTIGAAAQDLHFDWVKRMDGGIGAGIVSGGIHGWNTSKGTGVVTDLKGNVYTIGNFVDTVDFDPGTNTQLFNVSKKWYQDIFISKLDPSGNFLWTKHIQRDDRYDFNNYAASVTCDTSGNIYITGEFLGKVDFDPARGAADTFFLTTKGQANRVDAFVLKLDSSGLFQWAKQIGGGEQCYTAGSSIALDAFGHLYVTGRFNLKVDFDPGPQVFYIKTGNNFINAFILKLDVNGNFVWARRVGGGTGQKEGTSIATDTLGNIYTCGSFRWGADFDSLSAGGASMVAWGDIDIYVAKLDSAGEFLWVKRMGGTEYEYPTAIALDDLGNVYTTGHFTGTAYFNPASTSNGILVATGSSLVDSWDVFVSKLDNNGRFVWANKVVRLQPNFRLDAFDIVADALGNTYVTGHFQDRVNFDPGISNTTLDARPRLSMYILKYTVAGSFDWVKQIFGPRNAEQWTESYAITLDRFGSLYTTGCFRGTVDFDPGTDEFICEKEVDPLNNLDIFIHKLSCSDTTTLSIKERACGSFVYDHVTYTESGQYQQRVPNGTGCYNTVMLDLTLLKAIKPAILVDEFELSVEEPYGRYQWLRDAEPIIGATQRTYAVKQNGLYRIVVENENGCVDTSDTYLVTNAGGTGWINPGSLAKEVTLFPNPTEGIIQVMAPFKMQLAVWSIEGKLLLQTENENSIDLGRFNPGIYLLRIADEQGNLIRIEKVIRK